MSNYNFFATTIPATGGAPLTVSGVRLDVQRATIIAHADNAGTIYVKSDGDYIPLQKGLSLSLGRGNLGDITVSGAAARVGVHYEQ